MASSFINMHDCSFLEDLDLEDEQVSFGDSDKSNHAVDMGSEVFGRFEPDAVVWPESTSDVSAVVEAANKNEVPVTAWAAGTSLEGNPVPINGGVTLDMTKMNDVLEVRPDDFQIDVEPAVYGNTLNEAVESHGLFLPPLPSSGNISTIGGMIANDASGMQTVKYGEIHDWVMELEVVLADGSVIEVGSKALKSSSGYNMKDLMIGSEGTLGIITRATMRLKGIPEQLRGGRAIFNSLEDASSAISDAVRSEVDVAKIELMDELSVKMANEYLGQDLPDSPMVFLEFHANHGVEEEIDFARTIFEANDVEEFEMRDKEEMDDLWEMRREMAFAVRQYDQDLTPTHPGDVTVPISRYTDMVRYIEELREEHNYLIPCFGHAGDGNIHYSVMVDLEDGDHVELGEELYQKIVRKAIEMDGTSTGEHGVGIGKIGYMELEHGKPGVEAMRKIKKALDPKGILNPGKIFPDEKDEEQLVGH